VDVWVSQQRRSEVPRESTNNSLEFFAEAIAVIATQAVATAKALLVLVDADRYVEMLNAEL
jgi:hypothetical protein